MKKTLLLAFAAIMSVSAFAQTKSVENFVRTMPCTNDYGQVIATQMGTIVLPYAPVVEGATLYELRSASATEWVFQAVTEPQANTPYVFVVDADAQEVRFNGAGESCMSDAPVASAAGVESAFVGSYKRQIIRKKIYYLSNDRINCSNGKAVMTTPYRAYFDGSVLADGVELADNVKLTFVNPSQAAITSVDASDEAESAVRISRQHISLQPGIYQINGKKAQIK